MLVNHANLALLFTGFKATFKRGWELAAPIWSQVAMEIPSGTDKEEYDWLGVAPGMREWVGDRVIQSLGSHGFTIENKDWEQTVGVERNRIADDRYGVYSPIVQRMGEAAKLHLDELVFGLINDGRTETCYDGDPFFSTSHPHEDAGSVSNLDSDGAGPYWYLLDLSSGVKPFIVQMREQPKFVSKTSLTDDNVFFQKKFIMGADGRYNVGFGLWQQAFASNNTLDADHFWQYWEAMRAFTADNGKPLTIRPTHLLVPSSLEREATELLGASLIDGGDTNLLKGKVSLIVSDHLATS